MSNDIGQTLISSLNNGIVGVAIFVPKLLTGVIIIIIGIIVSSLLKQLVVGVLKALKVESLLRKYSVPEAKEEFTWTNILAEIARWFVLILFLIPAVDVWGLSRVFTVLNEFLLYLPNVFVAAIIGLVGFVFAKLAHDVVLASAKTVSSETANAIAGVSKWAVNVFVILAVLNQLGVATDLIRILFTGFVAMVAIAGGISFGLGGKDAAKGILDAIKNKLK